MGLKRSGFGHEPQGEVKGILGIFKQNTPSIQNEYKVYYQEYDDPSIYERRLKGRNNPQDIAFYSSDLHEKPQRSKVKETAIMKDINNVKKRRG